MTERAVICISGLAFLIVIFVFTMSSIVGVERAKISAQIACYKACVKVMKNAEFCLKDCRGE